MKGEAEQGGRGDDRKEGKRGEEAVEVKRREERKGNMVVINESGILKLERIDVLGGIGIGYRLLLNFYCL